MTRRRAVVICPGRGAYNRDELGSLARLHGDKTEFLDMVDAYRTVRGKDPVRALDAAASFSASHHSRGDNASPLIYACAFSDFLDLDRDRLDVVAVTGNSMGWYIALACAGAVSPEAGLEIVDTMGALMHERGVGGQLVYPVVDEQWREIAGKRAELVAMLHEIDALPGHSASLSIDLGGMLVFAANEPGLAALAKALPPVGDRYPMRLNQHAAFHSPLQQPVALEGQRLLGVDLFHAPATPMIDGRGHIWRPREVRPCDLRNYTLGAQVTEPYDFARAVRTSLREFAPDLLIVLGPGGTLGGAVAQTLIAERWRGLANKADFQAFQQRDPFLLAMSIPDQRDLAQVRQSNGR